MTGFRVLVVDDEPLARAMVGALIGTDPEVSCVVECGDARAVPGLIAEHRPTILVNVPTMMAQMIDSVRQGRCQAPDMAGLGDAA